MVLMGVVSAQDVSLTPHGATVYTDAADYGFKGYRVVPQMDMTIYGASWKVTLPAADVVAFRLYADDMLTLLVSGPAVSGTGVDAWVRSEVAVNLNEGETYYLGFYASKPDDLLFPRVTNVGAGEHDELPYFTQLRSYSNQVHDDTGPTTHNTWPAVMKVHLDPTDTDSDGVGDTEDNCPLAPNSSQSDGDFDDVGDACDLCDGDDASGDIDDDGTCALDVLGGIVDCDDLDDRVRPGLEDVCDNVDNDCDTYIDEDCDTDLPDADPLVDTDSPVNTDESDAGTDSGSSDDTDQSTDGKVLAGAHDAPGRQGGCGCAQRSGPISGRTSNGGAVWLIALLFAVRCRSQTERRRRRHV